MNRFHFPSYCLGMVTGAGMGLFACSMAHADTYGPGDMVPISDCPASIGALSPQVWSGPRIEYANTLPNPQHGVIRYPAGGTGGSGGHSPEPEAPAPVDLPASLGLLGAAVSILGFCVWRTA